MEKKLHKSANKKLAGVCAGIAEYFDIDPTLIRLLYAGLTLFTAGFPGIVLYIICMFVMPDAEQDATKETVKKDVQEA